MSTLPEYSVAIRTLGKAGRLYEDLIRCLKNQTYPPKAIFVYLAEGYQQPEAVADEIYITCPKGMVRQRALQYEEINTEYILFCDDDVYLPPHAIQELFDAMMKNRGDCIAPNVFQHHKASLKNKIMAGLYSETLPSFFAKYAIRIRMSSHFSYVVRPQRVMPTQSFAGICFLVKKALFLAVHFEDECWMDQFSYALGDDQLLAYKMYLAGYSLLTYFDSGIEHKDAKTGHVEDDRERLHSKYFLRYVIWYRSIYQTRISRMGKCRAIISYYCAWLWHFIVAFLLWMARKKKQELGAAVSGLRDARRFVKSEEYLRLPVWQKVRG